MNLFTVNQYFKYDCGTAAGKDTNMKEGIHPGYKECKVTCACGNEFITKSMKEEMRLDVCSACHPFFTGQQKFINRGGRVEKFKNKYNIG